MAKNRIVLLFLSASLIFSPLVVSGNGFDIYEQSAKAVGMGGAFTAQADDPSAIFFNPAGIAQLEGTQVSIGVCAIKPTMSFRSDGNPAMGTLPGQGTTIKDHIWMIPNAYITHKINEKFTVGLGLFSHFGLGVEWPENWEGRFTAGTTKTVLNTASISPVVAFTPSKTFSIGFGPYFQYFDIELNNLAFIGVPSPPFTPDRNRDSTASVKLSAKDWGLGWQAGVRVKITDSLFFGAAYLSEVKHKLRNGDQELHRISDSTLLLSQGFSSDITMPATLRLGLAWKKEPWTIEIGAQWTEWSSYKTLRADFDDGSFMESQKKWRDVWMWRIGMQYRVNKYLDLRAGFLYDQSPIPSSTMDPLVPSGDRKVYCGGIGVHLGKFTVDVGYNFVQDQKRRWNNSSGDVMAGPATLTRVTGKFKDSYAHIFSINTLYAF